MYMAKKTQKKKKGGMNFLTYQFTDAYSFGNAAHAEVSKMKEEIKNSDPEVMKYEAIFYCCATIKLYLEKAKKYKYNTKDKLYVFIKKRETTVPYKDWIPYANVRMKVIQSFFDNNIYNPGGNSDDNSIKYSNMSLKEFIKTEGPDLLKKKFSFEEEEIGELRTKDTEKNHKYADDMETGYLISKINFLSNENTAESNELPQLIGRAQELKEKFEELKKKKNIHGN